MHTVFDWYQHRWPWTA